MTTIRCFYTCGTCGLQRQHVDVPERDASTQDVVMWLEQIATPALVADHHRKSPLCRPKTFTEVGIPFDEGSENVGENVRS